MAKQQPTPAQATPAITYYRTTKALDGVGGKVSGRTYTCTEGTLLAAPEGEFEGLDHVRPETV